MMFQLFANLPASPGISPEMVGTIIGSVIIALIGGGFLGKRSGKAEGKAEGKTEAMMMGPQPFIVQLKEEFPTRREFDKLEGMVLASAVKTETAVEKLVELNRQQSAQTDKRIANQNDRLTKQIAEMGSGAYQGRQKIHVIQNQHAERIAALEANAEVAAKLDRLADAILTVITKKES
jgi:hypothetical protein